MPKPNLFLVGFPKAGTTSLAAMLRKHSQIFSPQERELHYFEVRYKNLPFNGPGDMKRAPIETEAEYLNLYHGRTEGYLLDYTPAYIEHPQVARDIKEFNPDAKIIIMLRDPVERCFSNYCHQVRKRCEELSFEMALESEERRKSDNWGMFWRYKENSFYYVRTKAYYDNFAAEDIKIILTQELRDNQDSIGKDIQGWLRLPLEDISINTEYNRSGRPNWKFNVARKIVSNPLIKSLTYHVVSRERILRFRNENVSRIILGSEAREKLRREFRSDIGRLETLINRDLSSWYE